MAMASAGHAPLQPVSSRQSSEYLAYCWLAKLHAVEVSFHDQLLLYRPPDSAE